MQLKFRKGFMRLSDETVKMKTPFEDKSIVVESLNDIGIKRGSNKSNDRSARAIPYQHRVVGTILFWIVSVATCGIASLILWWLPTLKFLLCKKKCTLKEATDVMIIFANGNKGTTQLEWVNITADTLSAPPLKENGSPSDGSIKVLSNENYGSLDTACGSNEDTLTDMRDRDSLFESSFYCNNIVEEELISIGQDGSFWSKQVPLFEYNCLRYIFSPELRRFKVVDFEFRFDEMNSIDFIKKGVVFDDLVEERRRVFGQCTVLIPDASLLKTIASEILHPYYVFQIAAIVMWLYDHYYQYACAILLITVCSTGAEVYETISQRKALRKLASIESTVSVLREGYPNGCTLSSSLLVPGDVIEITNDMIVPADVILLDGMVIVNEAMLTGESAPVLKNSLIGFGDVNAIQKKGVTADKVTKSTLYAGTSILAAEPHIKNAKILAVVNHTSYCTARGKLLHRILNPFPPRVDLIAEGYKYMAVLAVLAVCSFCLAVALLVRYPIELKEGVIRALDILTDALPPALPAALCAGITIAVSRLRILKNVSCVAPNRITIAGMATVMVLDKTGTLTEDGLGLECVIPVETPSTLDVEIATERRKRARHDTLKRNKLAPPIDRSNGFTRLPKLFEYAMASCHSLASANGKTLGESLEHVMFEATKWSFCTEDIEYTTSGRNSTRLQSPSGNTRECTVLELIRRFEFYSTIQRMSVIVKDENDGSYYVFCKGSPEVIKQLCIQESLPNDIVAAFEKYASNGMRTLAIAGRKLNLNDFNELYELERKEVECDLHFLGFLLFTNHVRPDSPAVIKELQNADRKCVMATGDSLSTAISIATECNIINRSHVGVVAIEAENNMMRWNDRLIYGGESPERTMVDDKVRHLCLICKHIVNAFDAKSSWIDSEIDEEACSIDTKSLNELMVHLNQIVQTIDVTFAMTGSAFSALRRMYTKLLSDIAEQISFGDDIEIDSMLLLNKQQGDDSLSTHFIESRMRKLRTVHYGKCTDAFSIEALYGQAKESNDENCIPGAAARMNSEVFRRAEMHIAAKTEFGECLIRKFDTLKLAEQFLEIIFRRSSVFARLSPMDKGSLVSVLQNSPHLPIVGMCGDGGNDCDALHLADVSISLSEAEAGVASSFKSSAKSIQCCVEILKEGQSALVNTIQLFKYIFLYAVIQTSSTVILYYFGDNFSDSEYLCVDVLVAFPLSLFMSWTSASDKISEKHPPDRLAAPHIVASVATQTVLQVTFQILGISILPFFSFYTPFKFPEDPDFDKPSELRSYENSMMLTLSVFQLISTCIAFSLNHPWRKGFHSNFILLGWLLILTLLLTAMNFVPEHGFLLSGTFEVIRHWLGFKLFPFEFAIGLIIYAGLNFLITLNTEILLKNWGIQMATTRKRLSAKSSIF